VQDPTFGRCLALEPDIFEVICVPKGVEIAFDGVLIENIAGPGKNVGANSFGGNTAVAVNFDCGDNVRLLLGEQTVLKGNDRNERSRKASSPTLSE